MFRCEFCLWKHVEDLVISVLVAAALGVLTPASAWAQATTWTVEIDITHQGGHHKTKPSYRYTRTVGTCQDSPSADPLYICVGDTVHWVVKSNKHKDSLGLLLSSFILLDTTGNATASFQAQDGNPTDGGKTVNAPTSASGVKYYLVVSDKDDGHEYPDDPKIIIRTGSVPSQVDEQLKVLDKSAQELQRLVSEVNPTEAKETKEDIEELRKIIEKLKKDLRER